MDVWFWRRVISFQRTSLRLNLKERKHWSRAAMASCNHQGQAINTVLSPRGLAKALWVNGLSCETDFHCNPINTASRTSHLLAVNNDWHNVTQIRDPIWYAPGRGLIILYSEKLIELNLRILVSNNWLTSRQVRERHTAIIAGDNISDIVPQHRDKWGCCQVIKGTVRNRASKAHHAVNVLIMQLRLNWHRQIASVAPQRIQST